MYPVWVGQIRAITRPHLVGCFGMGGTIGDVNKQLNRDTTRSKWHKSARLLVLCHLAKISPLWTKTVVRNGIRLVLRVELCWTACTDRYDSGFALVKPCTHMRKSCAGTRMRPAENDLPHTGSCRSDDDV